MKQIYLFLCGLLLSISGFAQTTTLINEDWESGSGSWTFVNHGTNAWYVGAPGANTGSNGVFISDVGGSTNTYNPNISQTSHFYQDVTIPGGSTAILLSLDLRQTGESGWDRLLIYYAPTTVTPVAGTPSSNSTTLTGATLAAITPISSGFIRLSYILPGSLAGTTQRIIFTWQNDASLGANPPASVDNILLTAAVPAPLNGVYTIDNTLPTSTTIPASGGNFNSFTDAVSYLNMHGISGPVTFNVTAGQTFTETGRNITATGTASNLIIFQKSGAGANPVFSPASGIGSADFGFAITGGDYITFDGIDVTDAASNTTTVMQAEYGFLIRNASATDGAMNNEIKNSTITLKRTNTTSIGLLQTASTTGGGVAPSATSGANSNNKYNNLTITNVNSGMYLLGNATYPDLNSMVQNNTVGTATANDIGGNTSTQTFGIRLVSQSSPTVSGNTVSNVTSSAALADGILVETAQGTATVNNNIVSNIRNASATSTTGVTGMRINLATTGTHTSRVFNNFVYGITSGYTGTASTTRQLKGIFVQSAGGGTVTSVHNIDFNNVLIDGSGSPTISSTTFEIGTSSGPIINVRNNVFANITGAQSGNAMHFTWVSTSATAIGSSGSVSDFNDLYLANTTNGFIGRGGTTNYAALLDWQTAMSQDSNSLSTDPLFVSSTDLHVSALALNGTANMTGITWVTVDIDNQTRVAPHDIGADQFTPPPADLGAVLLVAPVANQCYTATEPVTVRIRNFGASALDFTTDNATVTVNVTGAITQTLTVTLTNNSLNSNNPLASNATLDVPMGNINMSGTGTYTFDAYTTMASDPNSANDTMATVSINVSAGTAAANNTTICSGSSSTLTLTGYSGTLQWQSSIDGGNTWVNETGTGNTSSSYTVTPSDTTMYRALVCGTLASNSVNIIVISSPAPTATGDTRCGIGAVTLTASGTNNLYWYTSSTGGAPIATGTTYTTTVTSTTTFYVENLTGSIGNVGLVDNTAGGGQQTSTAYLIFDVLSPATLVGVHVYPGAAGNVVLDLRDNTGALITSASVSVTASQVNTKTFIPLNFSLTPGTNFRLAQGSGSVSMFRNSAGVTYPYTLPGVVSITNSSAGASFYYFSYDWVVSTGCPSTRISVTATVNPAPAMSATASATTTCAGDTLTLTASSANTGYTYTWNPGGLVGASVSVAPTTSTSYIVSAFDSTTACANADTVSITVNVRPVLVNVSATPSTVCSGDTVQLEAEGYTQNSTVNNYQFSTSTGATLDPMTGATQLLNPSNDDTPTGSATSIGFNFPYEGVNYTQFWVSPDGWIKLGSAAAVSQFTNSVTSTTNIPKIYPLWDDLATGTTGHVKSVVTGTAPNRILKVEWFVTIPRATTGPANSTFQAWLYETSGKIEFRYGAMGNPPSASGGLTGAVATNYQSLTFNANTASTTTANNGNSVSPANGRMYTFTPQAVNYMWSPATFLSSQTIANPVAAGVTSTTTYTVEITSLTNGCTVTAPVTITVNPLPVVSLPGMTVCADEAPFNITATPATGGTFTGPGIMGNMFHAAMANIGANQIIYTYTDTNMCTNSDTATFTVNALPVVSLASTSAVCIDNGLVSLSGLESPTGGTFSGTGVSGTDFDPMAAGAGMHDIVYTYTDANMCTNSDTASITVNALPVVSFTPAANVCINTASFSLVPSTSPTGGTFSSASAGLMGTSFDPPTAGTGSHQIIYSYVDTNGCQSSDTATIIVNSLPSVTLSAYTPVCDNIGLFDLTPNASPAGGVFTGTGVTGSNFDPLVAGLGSHTITYTYTDPNGCSNVASSSIVVNASPSVSLGSDITQCGGTATLDAQNPGSLYVWNTSQGTQTITVSSSGLYSVTVINNDGCSDSDTINVTINALPVANGGPDTTICVGESIVLIANPGMTTYLWQFGSFTANTQSLTASPGVTTAYTLTITDPNGCMDTDTIIVTVDPCVGIEDNSDLSSVIIAPNPSTGIFNLVIADANAAQLYVDIIDMQGKLVYSLNEKNISGNYTKEVSLEGFAKGVYYLRLNTGAKVSTHKLIIQ